MAKKKVPPQEQAFLDDIRAHPDEDTAARIFADWLDDHGQSDASRMRGEFIRVQCDLAGMAEDDPRRPALKEREWELLAVYRDEWLQVLPAWARQWNSASHRGFIERVNLTATQFLKQGRSLFAVTPIRDLQLRAASGRLPEIATSPLLDNVVALDLGTNLVTDEDLRALTTSPHLEKLTALTLRHVVLPPAFGEVLAHWPRLLQLRHLDLSGNPADPPILHELAKSPPLPSLRCLKLGGIALDISHLGAVLAGRRLAGLTHLELGDVNCSAEMAALVEPGALPNLTSLDASGARLDEQATDLLGRSELLDRLEVLELSHSLHEARHLRTLLRPGRTTRLRRLNLAHNNNIGTAEGMQALAAAPLDALRSLDLGGTGVDAAGMRILAASPRLAGLRALWLSGLQFGDAGARALAASPYLTNLTELHLTGTGITPQGAAVLAAWPGLARMRTLALDGNPLGPEGVAALAASPHLGNLYHLSLGTTDIGDDGVRALAASPNLGNLPHLNLWGYQSPDDSALRELANSPCLPRLLVLKVQVVMIDSAEELRKLGRTIAV